MPTAHPTHPPDDAAKLTVSIRCGLARNRRLKAARGAPLAAPSGSPSAVVRRVRCRRAQYPAKVEPGAANGHSVRRRDRTLQSCRWSGFASASVPTGSWSGVPTSSTWTNREHGSSRLGGQSFTVSAMDSPGRASWGCRSRRDLMSCIWCRSLGGGSGHRPSTASADEPPSTSALRPCSCKASGPTRTLSSTSTVESILRGARPGRVRRRVQCRGDRR